MRLSTRGGGTFLAAGIKKLGIDCASRSSRESQTSRPGTVTSGRESSVESLDRIHTFNLKNNSTPTPGASQKHSQSVTEVTGSAKDTPSKQPSHVYQNLGHETSTPHGPIEVFNGLKVTMVDGVSITAKPEPVEEEKK